jgi:hypothetical protein
LEALEFVPETHEFLIEARLFTLLGDEGPRALLLRGPGPTPSPNARRPTSCRAAPTRSCKAADSRRSSLSSA